MKVNKKKSEKRRKNLRRYSIIAELCLRAVIQRDVSFLAGVEYSMPSGSIGQALTPTLCHQMGFLSTTMYIRCHMNGANTI